MHINLVSEADLTTFSTEFVRPCWSFDEKKKRWSPTTPPACLPNTTINLLVFTRDLLISEISFWCGEGGSFSLVFDALVSMVFEQVYVFYPQNFHINPHLYICIT